jgi:hypothetical protein
MEIASSPPAHPERPILIAPPLSAVTRYRPELTPVVAGPLDNEPGTEERGVTGWRSRPRLRTFAIYPWQVGGLTPLFRRYMPLYPRVPAWIAFVVEHACHRTWAASAPAFSLAEGHVVRSLALCEFKN